MKKPEPFAIDFFPFVKFGGVVIPLKSLFVSGPTAYIKKILDLKSLDSDNLHSQSSACS